MTRFNIKRKEHSETVVFAMLPKVFVSTPYDPPLIFSNSHLLTVKFSVAPSVSNATPIAGPTVSLRDDVKSTLAHSIVIQS